MKVKFWKMSGAGNDFVCLDNRDGKLKLSKKQIAALCHRQFGVGGDGALILELPGKNKKNLDYRMRYYNADGGEAEMCGNGARCFARYAQKVTKSRKKQVTFQTKAGVVSAEYLGDDVCVGLTSPQGLLLNQRFKTPEGSFTVHSVNTGVPHAVVFMDDVEKIDIKTLGALFRYHKAFQPNGTNVNFAQILSKKRIRVRTYERGVEGETLACGTGVTAVALITHLVYGNASPVDIKVQGGPILKILFDKNGEEFTNVRLRGPAEFVFKGEIDV